MRRVAVLAIAISGACSSSSGTPSDAAADVSPADAAVDAGPPAPFVLAGQRWLLPCTTGNLGSYDCNCASGAQRQTVPVTGVSTEHWVVTVRIRGVMEAEGFNAGVAGNGGWYAGGQPNTAGNNYFSIIVSTPAQHYYVNNGTATAGRSFAFDYTASFPVDGGALVTFESNGQDAIQSGNYDDAHQPIMIPGVATTPSPYDGQFGQLDLIGAYRL